jgi:hypothetical protein
MNDKFREKELGLDHAEGCIRMKIRNLLQECLQNIQLYGWNEDFRHPENRVVTTDIPFNHAFVVLTQSTCRVG